MDAELTIVFLVAIAVFLVLYLLVKLFIRGF
jgi:hypothetical protein